VSHLLNISKQADFRRKRLVLEAKPSLQRNKQARRIGKVISNQQDQHTPPQWRM
jgi:hypothetical protein